MKQLLSVIFSVALLATPLAAQDMSAQITDQLRAQGYERVEITKTWLGRLRIEARSNDQTREIIVNPRTGEILRDFLSKPNGKRGGGVHILERPARGSAPERSGPGDANAQSRRPSGGSGRGAGPDGSAGGGSRGPSR